MSLGFEFALIAVERATLFGQQTHRIHPSHEQEPPSDSSRPLLLNFHRNANGGTLLRAPRRSLSAVNTNKRPEAAAGDAARTPRSVREENARLVVADEGSGACGAHRGANPTRLQRRAHLAGAAPRNSASPRNPPPRPFPNGTTLLSLFGAFYLRFCGEFGEIHSLSHAREAIKSQPFTADCRES